MCTTSGAVCGGYKRMLGREKQYTEPAGKKKWSDGGQVSGCTKGTFSFLRRFLVLSCAFCQVFFIKPPQKQVFLHNVMNLIFLPALLFFGSGNFGMMIPKKD